MKNMKLMLCFHTAHLRICAINFFIFSLFLSGLYAETAKVKRVVDGDTLLLEDGRKVRLIGVDTPEVHDSAKLYRDAARSESDVSLIKELGMRSSAFTKSLVENRDIELEYEISNKMYNNMDKYGRTLAYVYFLCEKPPAEYIKYLDKKDKKFIPGRIMLNRILLQCGYANVYTRFPYEYMDEFRSFEREAREFDLGLWHASGGLKAEEPDSPVIAQIPIKDYAFAGSKKSNLFHYKGCPHLKNIKPGDFVYFESMDQALASGRKLCRTCSK